MSVCGRMLPTTGTFRVNTHRMSGSNCPKLKWVRTGFVLVKAALPDWLASVLYFNPRWIKKNSENLFWQKSIPRRLWVLISVILTVSGKINCPSGTKLKDIVAHPIIGTVCPEYVFVNLVLSCMFIGCCNWQISQKLRQLRIEQDAPVSNITVISNPLSFWVTPVAK